MRRGLLRLDGHLLPALIGAAATALHDGQPDAGVLNGIVFRMFNVQVLVDGNRLDKGLGAVRP